MPQHTVLIVDDDPHIRDVLRYVLEKDGISVIEAQNGREGIEKALQLKPHMIIMDVMMPELSGLDACRELRRSGNIPMLFLSSRDSEYDRVLGLELGGDDYVNKPFSPRELMARIKVMLRRVDSSSSLKSGASSLLSHKGLTLNLDTFQVRWQEAEVSLTVTEFNLLQTLMQAPNQVFTRDMLSEGDIFKDIITDRTIDSHIRRLRRKLDAAGCINAIETVHGFGYRLGFGQ
jgi:two-component system OmpR family response regulator